MKTTDGDLNSVPCPHCQAAIKDLWDAPYAEGDEVYCYDCRKTSRILHMEEVTFVTLGAEEENDNLQ